MQDRFVESEPDFVTRDEHKSTVSWLKGVIVLLSVVNLYNVATNWSSKPAVEGQTNLDALSTIRSHWNAMKKDVNGIKARLSRHASRISALEKKAGVKNGGCGKTLTFAKLPSKLAGNWYHVRHVNAASRKWHPTNDDLKGTASYGTQSSSTKAAPWSVKFNVNNVKSFMFATGTGNKWVAINKSWIWKSSSYAKILGSSYSTSVSSVYTFYSRSSGYSPRVTYRESSNYNTANNLYLENSYTSDTGNPISYDGADVYVRYTTAPACGAGGKTFSQLPAKVQSGWKWVRHCNKRSQWHPSGDHLKGTDKYGSPSNNNAPWTIKWNYAQMKQYLFMT
jgi:hypothetical protein